MRNRTRVLLAAAAAAALLCVPTAALAQYGQGTDQECIRLQNAAGQPSTTFAQGEEFRVIGGTGDPNRRCGDPGQTVEFHINPMLGGTQVNAQGGYVSPQLNIPPDTVPGPHTIQARTVLNGVPVVYSRGITVTALDAPKATPAPPVRMPVTGSDIAIFAIWGVALVVFGALLVMAYRKRPAEDRETSPGRKVRRPLSVFDATTAGAERSVDRDAPATTADVPRIDALEPLDWELVAPVPEAASAPLQAQAAEGLELFDEPAAAASSDNADDPSSDPADDLLPARSEVREPVLVGVGAVSATEGWAAEARQEHTENDARDESPASIPDDAPIEEVVRRATSQTSQIVERLRAEIQAWNDPQR